MSYIVNLAKRLEISSEFVWHADRARMITLRKHWLAVFMFLLLTDAYSVSAAQSPYHVEFQPVVSDITLVFRPNVPRFPVVGNAVIIPVDNGVVLVDGGGNAALTTQIIEHIESNDLGPVKYLVLTHWHSDHSVNIDDYLDMYPQAKIVSHPWTKTRIQERLVNEVSGMANDFIAEVDVAKEELRSGRASGGMNTLSVMQRRRAEELVADSPTILNQKQLASTAVPDIATLEMTLPVNSRRIELIDLGCGNTPGDLVAWLPEEKVLIGGDILTWPVPFGFPPCPSRTIATLERLLSFDFDYLVLGHGPIQTDRSYGNKVLDLHRHSVAEIYRLHAEGLGVSAISKRLRLQPYDAEITQGSEATEYFFDIWYRQQIVDRTVREIESK